MGLDSFHKAARPSLLRRLAGETFDLLVIGGGITGACIFRDAALRGAKVALVEAGDFASGTSSRSSKLIHGGLRYLKTLGLGLARESCHERNLHVRLNKRLVRPAPFLVPLFRGGESRARLRAGMLVYEAVSGFGNERFHRFLTREETLTLAPGVQTALLTGGCVYYDAIVSDNRWTLETIKDGVRQGALALNYSPVTALLKTNGTLTGATVRDSLSGATTEIRARVIVNATGVFTDSIRRMDSPSATPLVRLSKGTHLVFREEDVPLSITTVFSSPLDGRPLFLCRRDGCFLYGTTDEWVDGDPGAPQPDASDADYLLESVKRFLPECRLGREQVQFVYGGYRPLLATDGSRGASSSASREDLLEESPSGLISVTGGKLTTARLMAIRVLERVRHRLPNSGWNACQTHLRPLGGGNEEVAEGLAHWSKRCPRLASYFRILFERYGPDAHEICGPALEIYEGRHPDPVAEPIRAEVQYVCRKEMVCTLEDLMERRAGFLYWSTAKRLERLRHGERVIREELNLTPDGFEEQFRAYRDRLDRLHTLP